MEILYTSIGLLIGLFICSICFYIWIKRHIAGKLRIDRSDIYDEPYIFLQLPTSVSDVSSKKFVILQVLNENFISQK